MTVRRAGVKVDPSVDRPLYKQLADVVRSQIRNGELVAGQRLPGPKDYMDEYYLSRGTVRRAMLTLCNEGLIVMDGPGTRVRGQTVRSAVPLGGGEIHARLATEEERLQFGIDEGVPVLVVKRDGQDEEEIYPADQVQIQVEIEVRT
ncbi:MAG TPA: GntR family transcriptional regulator [Streptosporangiaceae bacterium]|nr:GntR family transcriptional regulator [Streptosporangiaceae bacterium]